MTRFIWSFCCKRRISLYNSEPRNALFNSIKPQKWQTMLTEYLQYGDHHCYLLLKTTEPSIFSYRVSRKCIIEIVLEHGLSRKILCRLKHIKFYFNAWRLRSKSNKSFRRLLYFVVSGKSERLCIIVRQFHKVSGNDYEKLLLSCCFVFRSWNFWWSHDL